MDLLEILPWGREEVEQEKAFLNEAWLSTPMLEEDYENDQTATGNDGDESDGVINSTELGHIKDAESSGTDESFIKWMKINDMELAMYQRNIGRDDLSKGYVEAYDWDSSDPVIPDPTQALLQEFETVCGEYHGTLTPPRSRTPSPPPLIPYIPVNQQPVIQSDATPVVYALDLAQELAMLDELVRDRAEALENATPAVSSTAEIPIPAAQSIPAPMQAPVPVALLKVVVPEVIPAIKVDIISPSMSPVSLQEVPASSEASPSPTYYLSPNSVASSSPESPRPISPNSSSCGEASDPEWVPTKVISKRQRGKPYSRNSRVMTSGYSSSERSELSPAPSTSRGRRAPRVKGQANVSDRKERKKEQNKNAATRYRQKKKAEAEDVASEERQLENKNDRLRAKAVDLAREVSYLKKLMKEMFKARGML